MAFIARAFGQPGELFRVGDDAGPLADGVLVGDGSPSAPSNPPGVVTVIHVTSYTRPLNLN
jgi:hypothetical protein